MVDKSINKLSLNDQEKIDRVLFENFYKKCFHSPIDNFPTEQLVFFIDSESWEIFCMGFNNDKNIVITAKHCFVDSGEVAENLAASDSNQASPLLIHSRNNFKAFILRDSSRLWDIEIFSSDQLSSMKFSANKPADDIAIVRLKNISELEKSKNFSSGTLWDEIIIANPRISGNLIKELIENKIDNIDFQNKLSRLIAIDSSPSCMIINIKSNCIQHACQTEKGLSGSPIFKKNGLEYDLIGVHTGTILDPQPCDFNRGTSIPNYGLLLN